MTIKKIHLIQPGYSIYINFENKDINKAMLKTNLNECLSFLQESVKKDFQDKNK